MPEINFIGETDFRNKRQRFGIRREDRRLHQLVIGRTGMGKSALLQNMVMNDLKAGEGVCFLDPHGEAVEELLDYIPRSRLDDVIYWDPADTAHPLSLNILGSVEPEHRHLVVSGVISVFAKTSSTFTERQAHILRNALLALMEDARPHTLLDVYWLLTDSGYRRDVVWNVKDDVVRGFWRYEFGKYAFGRGEGVAPLLNKFGSFLTYPLMRSIVGQPKDSLDFRQLMDRQIGLLVNLAQGRLGEDASSFLGSLIVLKLQLAALSRIDTPEHERNDFYLYLDEAQSFVATEALESTLSQARKFKLNACLSHQYIDQLDEGLRKAVFGNVGTIVAFPVGPIDARFLEPHFAPEFTASDLVDHQKFHMYLRLAIDGKVSKPFSAVSFPPMFDHSPQGMREQIVTASRARIPAH